MKDFDAERAVRHKEREKEIGDRSFKLGGHVFTFKANVPFNYMEEVGSVTAESSGGDVLGALERFVLDMIEGENGEREKLKAILHNPEEPITFADLNDLVVWLIEQQTQRPTTAPSPSTPGRKPTGTTSTEESSSTPAAA